MKSTVLRVMCDRFRFYPRLRGGVGSPAVATLALPRFGLVGKTFQGAVAPNMPKGLRQGVSFRV